MKSAIRKLFTKLNEDMEISAEYKKIINEFATAHKKFINSLDGELKERAEEVFDLNDELNYVSAYDYFKAGLKFGLLLGAEINEKW